jgi:molecular chaperone HtpG
LDEYIENTKKNEKSKKEIFYITGKSLNELKSNPYVEQFKEHEIDVLLMPDPIDEFVITNLQNYKEYDLKSISSSDIEFEDEKNQDKKKETEKKMSENKDFIAFFLETI